MQCLINGVSYQLTRNFSINDRLANKAATKIEVLVENQPIPHAGDIVNIYDDAEPIFFGVAGIPVSPEYNTGYEKRIYTITCQNGNAILANRITNEAYQNTTVSDIVADLFTKYISAEGITLGSISSIDLTMEVYTAVDYNLQSAMNELAGLSDAAWMVSPDRKFYFIAREDFPALAYVLNDSNFEKLHRVKETTKSYKLRTVEHIVGATDTTSIQTETFLYNTETDTFTLGFPVSTKPSVAINGTDVTSHVGVNGIDDGDNDKYFFFGFNSNVLSYRYYGATPPLKAGDTITVNYRGIFNIRVTAKNEAKIAELAARYGTSGLIEHVDTSNAKTQLDATRAANAYLLEFSEITRQINLRILTDILPGMGLTLADLGVMTQVHVDLARLGISGDFVIVERTLSPAYAEMTSTGAVYRMLAEFVLQDRDYLSGYGQTISSMQEDISALQVRADDLAIQNLNAEEYRNRTEELELTESFENYPVGTGVAVAFRTWPGIYVNTTGLELYPGV